MTRVRIFIALLALSVTSPFALAGAAFPQGVASGDALPDRAICWTRTSSPGDVRIDVARDEGFSQIVASAVATATDDTGLTIKYEATALAPSTLHWFRFTRMDTAENSPTGMFVTAPDPAAEMSLRFVYSGDADSVRQPFSLLGFAADEHPNLWFFAGDTIYSDEATGDLGIVTDLPGYRAKYAQSKSDSALQRLSATASVWVQWDDHEVANDYDGAEPEPGITAQQIADAYQAFFENQPIRDQGAPDDPRRAYRSFRYGTLAEFFVLDCRQYRTRDAGRDGGGLDPFGYLVGAPEPDTIARINDASRSMLGATQLSWLKQGLAASAARWKFILSSVTFTSLLVQPYDRWDGYAAERYSLLRFIDDNRIDGVVILSADIHGNTYNPDVTHYLRNSLGQSFSPGFFVPEFVVGPIGRATIRQEIADLAGGSFDLPTFFRDCPPLLNLLVDYAQYQVHDRNRLAFLEPNRYAYLLVDVTPQRLTLTHKGIPPNTGNSTTPIATLNTVQLPTQPLCGVLPANLLITMLLTCGFGRRKRGRTKRPPRSISIPL